MTVMTSPESLSVLVAAGAGHGDPAGAAVVAADAPGLRAEGPVLHTHSLQSCPRIELATNLPRSFHNYRENHMVESAY